MRIYLKSKLSLVIDILNFCYPTDRWLDKTDVIYFKENCWTIY